MSYVRLGIALAVLAALAAGFFAIRSWDRDRLQDAYDRGVAAERAAWESVAALASVAQAQANQASTRDSEAAGDRARQESAQERAATAAQTQSAVEEIVDARQAQPAPVCRPDGHPGPLPDRVLRALDRQRAAAYGRSSSG